MTNIQLRTLIIQGLKELTITIGVIIAVFVLINTTGCATPTVNYSWDVKDQGQFKSDWDHCTSMAIAYNRGDDFRTRCMTTRGHLIKTTYSN